MGAVYHVYRDKNGRYSSIRIDPTNGFGEYIPGHHLPLQIVEQMVKYFEEKS
jgi:hypothetical protein